MEVKEYLQNAEDSMQLAVEYLDDTLSHIRAGKASARLLDGIRVDYYGTQSPISNVANVSVPDARTIAITPWEKSMFKEIEKAIINSELGITPENNGEVIRLSIPPLTEDRRKQLVKQSKAEAETAKVSVRNARGKTKYHGMSLKELNHEENRRKQYYEFYTGQRWGEPTNYDMMINTSNISLETAANTILAYIQCCQNEGRPLSFR